MKRFSNFGTSCRLRMKTNNLPPRHGPTMLPICRQKGCDGDEMILGGRGKSTCAWPRNTTLCSDIGHLITHYVNKTGNPAQSYLLACPSQSCMTLWLLLNERVTREKNAWLLKRFFFATLRAGLICPPSGGPSRRRGSNWGGAGRQAVVSVVNRLDQDTTVLKSYSHHC